MCCLGRDLFLLLFPDSVLHFAHNCERIHPLCCGRPLRSCVSLCFSLVCDWPDELVWDKLSRCERSGSEVFMVRGGTMMQLVSSVTTGHDSSWTKVQPKLSLFRNR